MIQVSGVARVIVSGGKIRAAKARGILGGSGLKSRVPQMRFPAFSRCDFAEKILLLMITHSHRRPPQFLLGFHPFTGVVLQLIGGAELPLAPPCLRH